MLLNLLRHGIAEARRAGLADADRALTDEGRTKLERVLKRAKAAGVAPSVILTSPLLRAAQTAQVAASILDTRLEIVRIPALSPEIPAEKAWDAIRKYADSGEVIVVGHEPQISALGAFVLACPSLEIDFRKGAILRVNVENAGRSPRGKLEWMLTPKLAGRLK